MANPFKQALTAEIYQQVLVGNSALERLSRRLVCGGLGSFAKLFTSCVYDFKAQGVERLLALLDGRDSERGLITVCNHTSTLDEPVLWAMLPHSVLWNIDRMRWTLAAEDVCFAHPFSRWFFGSGHGISVRRGAGLQQPGVEHTISKLVDGHWVHIFPEGKVFQTGQLASRLKWGVGKCLAAATARSPARKSPIVLPFYHLGMEKVVPLERFDTSYGYPTVFGDTIRIRVQVGEPFVVDQLVEPFIAGQLASGARASRLDVFRDDTDDERCLYSSITAEIADRLRVIEKQMYAAVQQ